MKAYQNRKDSGVAWIGEVPEHWDTGKLKYLSNAENGYAFKSDDFQDSGVPIVRIGDVLGFDKNTKYLPINFLERYNRYKVEHGDVLIAMSGATVGKVGQYNLEKNALLNQRVCKISANNKSYKKFLWFNLLSDGFNKYVRLNALGGAQENISHSQILEFEIPLPPKPEQSQIVAFLDKKTAKIDTLIANKERKIELLKEKRKALINRAVTKGLDPEAPMKDSGVEWIGEIPEGWSVKKLKYIAEINPSKKKIGCGTEDVIFLPMEKVGEDGSIDQNNIKKFDQVSSGYTYFEKNDILLAKITPCFENGKGAYLNKLKTDIGFGSTEFHVVRPQNDVSDKFVFYNLRRKGFKEVGETFMSGAAGQKRVSTDFLKEWLIGIPSIEEQAEIVNYLNTETSEIDQLIKKESQKIELLQEYRQSLIAEAVTGKIDIRDEVDIVSTNGQSARQSLSEDGVAV